VQTTSVSRVITFTVRVLFGAVVAIAATASPAAAHTALKASSPKAGAQVNVPPAQVTLAFTDQMRTGLARVSVRGPGDARFESGPPQIAGNRVVQSLRPLGAAGRYQIVYRVVSADGHPVAGSVRFTLTRPGPGAATATSASSPAPAPESPAGSATEPATNAAEDGDDGGPPAWALAVGAVALVVFVAGAVWFGRRATRELD
jgi:methionine-rich copper-binding protein CopC